MSKDSNKGNYCLIISVSDDCEIKIGAKGKKSFKKGYYVYVGSALNSLTKRIERHISRNKKIHWHADYLLLNKNAKVEEVIYTYSSRKIECKISHEISKNAINYIEEFGCSDCECESHLYYFDSYDDALKSSIDSYKNIGYEENYWFKKQ